MTVLFMYASLYSQVLSQYVQIQHDIAYTTMKVDHGKGPRENSNVPHKNVVIKNE